MSTVFSRTVIAPPSQQVTDWLEEWGASRSELGRNDRVTKLRRSYVGEFRIYVRRNKGVDLDCEDNSVIQDALREFADSRQGPYKMISSVSTMQAKLNAVRAFFRWLGQEGIAPRHWLDFEGIIASKARRHVDKDKATAEEVVNNLYAINRTTTHGMRDFIMIALSAYVNFNFNGVLHMVVGDVHPENDEVSIPHYSSGSNKEISRRTVTIPQAFSSYLTDYIQALYLGEETDDAPLFPRMQRADWREMRQGISEMMMYISLTSHLGRQNLRQAIVAKELVEYFEERLGEL